MKEYSILEIPNNIIVSIFSFSYYLKKIIENATDTYIPCHFRYFNNFTHCLKYKLYAKVALYFYNEKKNNIFPNSLLQRKAMKGMKFRIQVGVMDCLSCGNCVDVCPDNPKAGGPALKMVPLEGQLCEAANWEYCVKNVKTKQALVDIKQSPKNSQFATPLFEFSGACSGCGETPYVKLISQLFGDRQMVANATGCSSIYSGSIPSTPYTTNEKGQDPAWANSLFEDFCEFGLGMIATTYGYVYVAQIAMGADQSQCLKAIREAEAYPGPSIVIAYAPCINHGLKKGIGKAQAEEAAAVECGYWHLWRYNPALEEEGKNPFTLDSKEPKWEGFQDFLKGEVRFASVMKQFPTEAAGLFQACEDMAKKRYQSYIRMSKMDWSNE